MDGAVAICLFFGLFLIYKLNKLNEKKRKKHQSDGHNAAGSTEHQPE